MCPCSLLRLAILVASTPELLRIEPSRDFRRRLQRRHRDVSGVMVAACQICQHAILADQMAHRSGDALLRARAGPFFLWRRFTL